MIQILIDNRYHMVRTQMYYIRIAYLIISMLIFINLKILRLYRNPPFFLGKQGCNNFFYPLRIFHQIFIFNYTNLNLEFHSSINSHYICANFWFWIFEFDHTLITDKVNVLHQKKKKKEKINLSRQSSMGPQKKLWIIFVYQLLVGSRK